MSENSTTIQRKVESVAPPAPDPSEINLLEYIYVLLKNKWLIISLTLFGFVGGYLLACLKGPTWVTEAVIAPKENESQKTSGLSSLGGFGSLVANQLNLGNNASLEKIELLLDSRDFNARLIERYQLLPEVYRVLWPKIYKREWDFTGKRWQPGFKPPPMLEMGSLLNGTFLKKSVEPNNTMIITIRSKDSTFSFNLARDYLEFLNEDIKSSTQSDAKENVDFLKKQLLSIPDPLLREKILDLIAGEIEKTMIVSKEAFRIVDPVYLSKKNKEKRIFPLIFSSGFFLVTLLAILLFHAFVSAEKNEEDQRLIEKIKSEVPFTGKHR